MAAGDARATEMAEVVPCRAEVNEQGRLAGLEKQSPGAHFDLVVSTNNSLIEAFLVEKLSSASGGEGKGERVITPERKLIAREHPSSRKARHKTVVRIDPGHFYYGEACEERTLEGAIEMDAYPVTNHEYWCFLSEMGHPMPPHWPGRVLEGDRERAGCQGHVVRRCGILRLGWKATADGGGMGACGARDGQARLPVGR